MNNLTTVLNDSISNYDMEEYSRQAMSLGFDSGKEQRLSGGTMPTYILSLEYNNISRTKYEALREAYENNYANTFILDIKDTSSADIETGDYVVADYMLLPDHYVYSLDRSYMDIRPSTMSLHSSTWAFKEFTFSEEATKPNLLSGRIDVVSSVFFDYPKYQEMFSESSSYTPNFSTDVSFLNLLEDAPSLQVTHKYGNASLASSFGASAGHMKDKGLRRGWTLSWVLPESPFIKLLTFYRKRAGIMGGFAMPELGYYSASNTERVNARFLADSFKYQRRLDGTYQVTADFTEVL